MKRKCVYCNKIFKETRKGRWTKYGVCSDCRERMFKEVINDKVS